MYFDGYNILAGDYDILNSHVDYTALCDYYEELFAEYHKGNRISTVIDLGCGTGNIIQLLGSRGYSLIGIDSSDEMLSIADQKIRDQSIKNAYLINGDMESFVVSEKADAVISSFDGINHILSTEGLLSCFSCVNLSLEIGGLFIFDVNTPFKFKTQFDAKDYIIETSDIFCAWHSQLNSKKNISDFYITVFKKLHSPKETWNKYSGYIRERSYSLKALTKCLNECGFKVLHVSRGYDNTSPSYDSDRWYVISSKETDIYNNQKED